MFSVCVCALRLALAKTPQHRGGSVTNDAGVSLLSADIAANDAERAGGGVVSATATIGTGEGGRRASALLAATAWRLGSNGMPGDGARRGISGDSWANYSTNSAACISGGVSKAKARRHLANGVSKTRASSA